MVDSGFAFLLCWLLTSLRSARITKDSTSMGAKVLPANKLGAKHLNQ